MTELEITEADLEAADAAVSIANIVSHDGYYEVDVDRLSAAFARYRIAAFEAGQQAGKDGLKTAYDTGYKVGVLAGLAQERADVVAWLNNPAGKGSELAVVFGEDFADAIFHGEHERTDDGAV